MSSTTDRRHRAWRPDERRVRHDQRWTPPARARRRPRSCDRRRPATAVRPAPPPPAEQDRRTTAKAPDPEGKKAGRAPPGLRRLRPSPHVGGIPAPRAGPRVPARDRRAGRRRRPPTGHWSDWAGTPRTGPRPSCRGRAGAAEAEEHRARSTRPKSAELVPCPGPPARADPTASRTSDRRAAARPRAGGRGLRGGRRWESPASNPVRCPSGQGRRRDLPSGHRPKSDVERTPEVLLSPTGHSG